MTKIIGFLFCLSLSGPAFAEDKIDWGICAKDLEKNCVGITGDHEKHECLEKSGKKRITKACRDYNHKLEDKFKEEHKDDHSH